MLCMLQVAYLVTWLQCVHIFTILHVIQNLCLSNTKFIPINLCLRSLIAS
jgi:hypothetical protein